FTCQRHANTHNFPGTCSLRFLVILHQPWGVHTMAHQVVWFDIPVLDLDRAIRFYSAVLGAPVKKESFPGMSMGVLPHEANDVGGCLHQSSTENPSDHGPLLYLNAQGRLDQAIAAVEANGGKILQPKHAIGPYGHLAIILDSEGNRLALHSM